MPTRSLLVLALLASAASADPVTEALSIPWQLRPVLTTDVVRADSTVAVFDDANGNLDISGTTTLSARYRLTERWAPILRLGFAGNNAPGAALDGGSLANPMLGATYTWTTGRRRVALVAATTLPIGTGGGDDADPRAAKTNAASITARPADEALFAVDYLTELVGADVAYVRRGVTLQAEAALQQSLRVRGARAAATDAFRTRAALGAHLGVALGRHVSLGADLLYQRWLSHPTERDLAGARVPVAEADLSRLTIAAGVRGHLRVGKASLRPGLAYTRGLGATEHGPMMLTNRTNAITFDLPVLF